MPDWSGRIWFVTSGGLVGAVDAVSGEAKTVTLQGERIANSLAVDESGGVFVVSDHALPTLLGGERVGDSLLVENNYGYTGPSSTVWGGVTRHHPRSGRIGICGNALWSSEVP